MIDSNSNDNGNNDSAFGFCGFPLGAPRTSASFTLMPSPGPSASFILRLPADGAEGQLCALLIC